MKKSLSLSIIVFLVMGLAACSRPIDGVQSAAQGPPIKWAETDTVQLLDFREALELFEEGTYAEVYDIEMGLTFHVKRTTGGYNTLADVEPLTKQDTETILKIAGGDWNLNRRAVILTIEGVRIAASITPFPHFGCDDHPHGVFVDNRNGSTGPGINLNSIRDNGMTGVVDIYFFNSRMPGINRVDEAHQAMVLRAYEHEN